ncbi:hypothetical protein R3P38DRAFT_2869163 [Favolaschia claudopus]|uniref:Zn(2)-C6 fungal-type domain-containing protein n=1 Tax=Favolaschia claudopus TaxID=2862362 RepID=A0AAW0D6I9_9AGAR
MGSSFSPNPFPLTPTLLSFSLLVPKSFFSLSVAAHPVVAVDRRGRLIMERKSSLPPSIQPYIWTRPQPPQGLSPTASSPGAQEELFEYPAAGRAHAPPTRQTSLPILPSLPAAFPDTRYPYSAYEPEAHDVPIVHAPIVLPAPERYAGPSSIPHGSVPGRYRSPVVNDPRYAPAGRSRGPSPYLGSQSLPALSQIPGVMGWREGEAGPSSLVHSHPHPYSSRTQTPSYLPPQQIHRRATEPRSYSTGEGAHVQHGFLSGFERLREVQPLSYTSTLYSEPRSVQRYTPANEEFYPYPPPVERRPPPTLSRPISLPSFQHLRDDRTILPGDETTLGKRKLPPEFETHPRQLVPRKILVACEFCRRRKLKCDGGRPLCSNCFNRNNTICEYDPHPKRRGPGKAAKGSRPKKRLPKTGRRSEPTASIRDTTDFDEETLVPSLRSRASFPDSLYSSQSTFVESRYDSRPGSPEWGPPSKRARTTKREPSSENYTGSAPPSDSESRQ